MMLLVVKFHDLTGDEWLEAIVGVGEVWKGVCHACTVLIDDPQMMYL
jgi:hypothetical protein